MNRAEPPIHLAKSCPRCGHGESRVRLVAGDFMTGMAGDFFVSRCARCGLLFQNPWVTPEELQKHYPENYAPYEVQEMTLGPSAFKYLRDKLGYAAASARPAAKTSRFRETFMGGRHAAETSLIPAHVGGGALLEIGCASGARLSLLNSLGWERCIGIELNPAAAHRARARGFDVRTGAVEEALSEIPDHSLDAVIAGFVLEHLVDPFAVAREIARVLKPGGQFLFSTIHVGSPDFRLYGRYWYNLDLPRHHVFFRRSDLRFLLDGMFGVERVTGIPAPNDYAGSSRYRFRDKPNLFDRMILQAGNRLLPLYVALARMGFCSRLAFRCIRR